MVFLLKKRMMTGVNRPITTITNSTIIVDNSGEVTVDNMQAGERLEKYEVELLRIYNALPSIRLQILFMQRALDFEEEFSGK